MAEDLSAWSEVDPNSRITLASSRITGAGINRNATEYSYSDKGADYFDALDIDFDIFTSNLDYNDILGVFGISNTLNHFGAFGTSDIRVAFYYPSGGARGLYLIANPTDYMAISLNTTYYCTLERVAGNANVSLKVYSDAARTTLLDTLTTTLATASTKHRYAFGIASQYTGATSYPASGYVENVVINAVSSQSVIPIMMAHRRRRIS